MTKFQFLCPHCNQALHANASLSGKRARCKQCQNIITIPGATQTVAPVVSAEPKTPPKPVPRQPPTQNPQPTSNPPTPPQTSPHKTSGNKNSTTSASSEKANPFAALPDFQTVQPQEAVAPQVSVFDETMMSGGIAKTNPNTPQATQQLGNSTPVTQNPGSGEHAGPAANAADPASVDFSQLVDGMQDSINAAVVQQHQRNVASIAPKLSVAQIQQAFQAEMAEFDHHAKVSGRLFSVACLMLILPMIFTLAVIGGTFLMLALPFLMKSSTGSLMPNPFLFVFYLGAWAVLLASWVPVVNLVRAVFSLFSAPGRSKNIQHVTRENQPVLFEFVEQICQKVGAPAPTQIDLDCEFNASASFRRGFLSFGSNDLVLTLGVPIIACQSTEQLASVVAHEFGHFRQGVAMRSDYLIRHLMGWFMQYAHYGNIRDKIVNLYDSELSNSSLYNFVSGLGYLGRQMMWCFGYVGHIFSGSLSREMEYDADRHAIHLAGSRAFIESMAVTERYAVAHEIAMMNAGQLFEGGSIMLKNIPRFTMYIGKTMAAETVSRLRQENEEQKEEMLDTHPPTRDRVAAANEANQNGILRIGRPATDLVHNWNALCQAVTMDLYSDVLGERVAPNHLSPLEEVLKAEHKLLLDRD